MAKIIDYPTITITKAEIDKLKAAGAKRCFEMLKVLAASRGLLYHSPRSRPKVELRVRTWFDPDKNLCLQNYAVDLASGYCGPACGDEP
jgi:hypothetical protein